jgi:hypothetical protein
MLSEVLKIAPAWARVELTVPGPQAAQRPATRNWRGYRTRQHILLPVALPADIRFIMGAGSG